MTQLCFATQNIHKIQELAPLFPTSLQLCTLGQLGCDYELAEDQDNLEGNALQKARHIYEVFGVDCFADDTGLEVNALGGQPGVRSARYAGTHRNDADNINLLLNNLADKTNRKARFRTCIVLFWQGNVYEFEGICEGQIGFERLGSNGFGYDPIFFPDNSNGLSFAQMDTASKNRISHRAIAFAKLTEFFAGLGL